MRAPLDRLPVEQQAGVAAEIVARAQALSAQVAKMLDQARQTNDTLRVTCLNHQLTRINANRKIGENHLAGFHGASNVGDTARRTHEFTLLLVIGAKLDGLEKDAHQCVGQSRLDEAVAAINPDIDPNFIPDGNPELGVPVVDVVIPPPASPTH